MTDRVQVVLPYLSLTDCLVECIESMGESDVPVLVVDNSCGSDAARLRLPSNCTVRCFPQNLGRPASWNLGLRREAEYTLICSEAVRFGPLGLQGIAEGIAARAPEWGMSFDDQGSHFMVVARRTVDRIGLYDENFWPGGLEDDDYVRRCQLAGLEYAAWPSAGTYSMGYGLETGAVLPDGEILGPLTADKTNFRLAASIQYVGRMRSYYEHKWGSWVPGHFTRPFNNRLNDLDYWPPVYFEQVPFHYPGRDDPYQPPFRCGCAAVHPDLKVLA